MFLVLRLLMVVGDSVIANSKSSCNSIRYLCPLGVVFTVSETRNNEKVQRTVEHMKKWFAYYMLERILFAPKK